MPSQNVDAHHTFRFFLSLASQTRRLHRGPRRLATDFPSPCADIPTVDNPQLDGVYDGWRLLDFCLLFGNTEDPSGDMTDSCHHNDDLSASFELPMGFTFDFYGQGYSEVFVNNNGNLSFNSSYSEFTSTGFPVDDFPMIAPFWADVDTGFSDSPLGHVWTKELASNKVAVAWEEVGYYFERGNLRNSFQVVISDGTDPSMGVGNNVCFCYEDMEWTTGDASQNVDEFLDYYFDDIPDFGGFGGFPATVGANKGDGSTFFQIGRFDANTSDYDGSFGNNDGVYYLNQKSFCFNVFGETNVPPIAAGAPTDNTVSLSACSGSPPLNLSFFFLGPEEGQTVTVVAENVPDWITANLNAGDPAQVSITGDPTDHADEYPIVFTATDSLGEVTVQTIRVEVNSCGVINGDPHIARWNRKSFDFHGECDLVMLHSETLNGDTTLDLHIRTEIEGAFSSITSAALRVGDDVVEITPYHVHYQGKSIKWEHLPLETANFRIPLPRRRFYGKPRVKMQIFLNDRSVIRIRRTMLEKSLDMLSITVDGAPEDFAHSHGLLGDYHTGEALGRDGRVITDWNEYGMEWQVQEDEPMLFIDKDRQPQLPLAKCTMPSKSVTRESLLSARRTNPNLYMNAQIACAKVNDLEGCMEDVLLSKDTKAAEAYEA